MPSARGKVFCYMEAHSHNSQLEINGLAGRLGAVSLDGGCVTAWDLVRRVHSQWQPGNGTFWKLVIDNEPISSKDIVITRTSSVTCVKCFPEEDQVQDAVSDVEEVLDSADD